MCNDVARNKERSCQCHLNVWCTTADKFTARVDWCYKSLPGRHTVQISHHVDPVSIIQSSETEVRKRVEVCQNRGQLFPAIKWFISLSISLASGWVRPRAFVNTDQLLGAVQIHSASFLPSPITLNKSRTLMDKSKHTKFAFSRVAQNESTAAAEGKQQPDI